MSEPLIGEIRIIPYTFAPQNWAWCEGQLVAVSQWQALFAVIGVTFGGNGSVNFGLPKLQGRAPLGYGQSPGLHYYPIGQMGGVNSVMLTPDEMPSHHHEVYANRQVGTINTPNSNASVAAYPSNRVYYRSPEPGDLTPMSLETLATAGASSPHENRQPHLVLNFCIALDGIFPSRN